MTSLDDKDAGDIRIIIVGRVLAHLRSPYGLREKNNK